VEFKTGDESGKSFPETNIRVKPNTSVAVDPTNSSLLDALKSQVNIMDLFPELSYEELKDVMDKWLNPDETAADPAVTATATDSDDDAPFPTATKTATAPKAAVTASPTAVKAKAGSSDDVNKAFDDLFNS
jgi:hypothetical protein